MTLPADIKDWPGDWQAAYLERLGLMLDKEAKERRATPEEERAAVESTREHEVLMGSPAWYGEASWSPLIASV